MGPRWSSLSQCIRMSCWPCRRLRSDEVESQQLHVAKAASTPLAVVDSEEQQLEELRGELERARRTRLRRLGVAEEAIIASELQAWGGDGAGEETVRVMQFNLLADALSNDGFLVRPVLQDWPGGFDKVPTAGGELVTMRQLLREILEAKGDADALGMLKSQYDVPATQANLKAVIDWEARELQVQLTVLAAGRPDILVFQELDHFATLGKALSRMGYDSQLPGRSTPYSPAHLEGHEARCPKGAARFRQYFDLGGHAFLPNLGSTAMKYALERVGIAQDVVEAARAFGLAEHVVDAKRGGLAKAAFEGLPGGSAKLLKAAGLENPASVDDDGVAVLWRRDRFDAVALQAHFFGSGKGGVLEVRLRARAAAGGRGLVVLASHLSSGSHPADEEKRLRDQVDAGDGLASLISACRESAAGAGLVAALDANAHPQLVAPDGTASVWRSLRAAAGASVWDGHFDPDGEARHSVPPVTTNKVRGPASDQVRKIGEHAYYCTDHIFFDPTSMALQGHARPPPHFASQTAALEATVPSLANPSDHYPVVVDLTWL